MQQEAACGDGSSVTVLEKKQNDTNERAAMLALKSRCSACGERVGAPF